MKSTSLTINAGENAAILQALGSQARTRILKLLCADGPTNVNEIAGRLALPKSSIASAIVILEEAGLVETKAVRAKNGYQKFCSAVYRDILIDFAHTPFRESKNVLEASTPIGLYTSCDVLAPCGIRSASGLIAKADHPEGFFEPQRIDADLIWFERGYVKYTFPNLAKTSNRSINALEFSMKLSSGSFGSQCEGGLNIAILINGVIVDTVMTDDVWSSNNSPQTSDWQPRHASGYQGMRVWRVTKKGIFTNDRLMSRVVLDDLAIDLRNSITFALEVTDDSSNAGKAVILGCPLEERSNIVMRLDVL